MTRSCSRPTKHRHAPVRVSPSGGKAEALASLATGRLSRCGRSSSPVERRALHGQRRPRRVQRREHHGVSHCRGERRKSSIAAAITVGIYQAAISSTSTTEALRRAFDLERLEKTVNLCARATQLCRTPSQEARSLPSPLAERWSTGQDTPWAPTSAPLDGSRRENDAAAERTGELIESVFFSDGQLAMEIREGPPNIWVYQREGDKLKRLTRIQSVRRNQPGHPIAAGSRLHRRVRTSRRSTCGGSAPTAQATPSA